MKILALTGGIATGKSFVAKIFSDCGAIVIDADSISHETYLPGTKIYSQIVKSYGEGILEASGKINHQKLAEILFTNEKEKKYLESLIHPETKRLIEQSIEKATTSNPPLILVEAALHIETGYYRDFEGLIVVHTRDPIQLERLMQRDALSKEEAKLKIKNQLSLSKKKTYAKYLIDNSGSREQTTMEVKKIFQLLT